MPADRIVAWVALHLIGTITVVLGVLALSRILRRHQAPSVTLAWLLFLALLPYLAVPLYFLVGGRKLEQAKAAKRLSSIMLADGDSAFVAGSLSALLRGHGMPAASPYNDAVFLASGEAVYDALVRMIDEAEESIWITTFVFGNDDVSRAIIERLASKARAGLQVCLLVDGVGSFKTPRRVYRPLIKAGGHVAVFSPVSHIMFRGRAHLRNHRKIGIVDRRRVLTGGTNIASDYIGPSLKPDRWKDIALLIDGESVSVFCRIFESDWMYATRSTGQQLRQGERRHRPSAAATNTTLQVVPSGPDVAGDALYDAIVQACFQAEDRIWIVSPYFVPDETLFQAVSLAARRGLDVRILVPRKSNHPLTDWARTSYLSDLTGAGARVFLFPTTMVHAKAMLFDDRLVMIGSANMDARSLRLNYEAMVFVLDGTVLGDAELWMSDMFRQAEEGTSEGGFLRETAEGLSRLLAPQL